MGKLKRNIEQKKLKHITRRNTHTYGPSMKHEYYNFKTVVTCEKGKRDRLALTIIILGVFFLFFKHLKLFISLQISQAQAYTILHLKSALSPRFSNLGRG